MISLRDVFSIQFPSVCYACRTLSTYVLIGLRVDLGVRLLTPRLPNIRDDRRCFARNASPHQHCELSHRQSRASTAKTTYTMADPSLRVAQQLRPHVHLISSQRYPAVAQLNLEQAFGYLAQAPMVVKQVASMSWQYIAPPPPDGTVWLEWLPPDRADPYASDGYVWADTEGIFRQDYGGYTIEIRIHQVGYKLGEQMAQHSRTRYHFLSKNPSVNAPPPDPSLWIVHYHRSDPSNFMNVAHLPMMPHVQQVIQQRRWLEGLGRLERQEFMLHDREKWPTVNLPGAANMQPGVYAPNPMGAMPMTPNRFQQPHYPQQAGVPPNKRARVQGPGAHPPPGVPEIAQPDSTIEDEENTSYGDYFDHLSQREISIARYTQHHRWMEEVFSSPYATNQIAPPDLGLGLAGELKGLTEGILSGPDMTLIERDENRPPQPVDVKAFTNLTKEQVDEFTKRVEKHLEEGKAEIERMKAEHAKKMQAWKTVNALAQAEKKLRHGTWAGHEAAVPVFRVEQPAANGSTEAKPSKAIIDDVVKDVENLLGVKVKSYENAKLVAKGGLRERKPPVVPAEDKPAPSDSTTDAMTGVENGQKATSNASAQPAAPTQAPPQAGGAAIPQSTPAQPSTASATQANASTASAAGASAGLSSFTDNTASAGLVDDSMLVDTDMNIDLDEPNPQFGNTQPPTTSLSTAPSAPAASTTQQQPAASASVSAALTGTAAETSDEAALGAADFTNDNTFNDLVGNDDENGLIDFDVGMDDSAFGDAMHGMDEAS